MAIHEKLMNIQAKLKAPKNQFNAFGKYKYRSCEDILEAVKPLLLENKVVLTITDEPLMIGDRFYIKATAKLTDIEDGKSIEVSALAREDENKKGMDLAQVTGSTSSYARKYALNGLFCIDDTKDSDATNKHGKDEKQRETIDKTKAQALRELCKRKGVTEEYVAKYKKKKTFDEFTLEEFMGAKEWLERKPDK
ncbi:ERF family protein [Caminicella sporogenes]|uniref:ERF family protein n=1 Tax=Caminicella sporogenes TaxID=166485 RepID=UPI00253F657E|nr:ERF family protein [Caminicella sporogenes]WIF95047.1 ERF family protein [Caminicella sporogenes]